MAASGAYKAHISDLTDSERAVRVRDRSSLAYATLDLHSDTIELRFRAPHQSRHLAPGTARPNSDGEDFLQRREVKLRVPFLHPE